MGDLFHQAQGLHSDECFLLNYTLGISLGVWNYLHFVNAIDTPFILIACVSIR